MQLPELIEILEKEYPNDITTLKGLTPEEVSARIAEVALIEHIKRLEKDN